MECLGVVFLAVYFTTSAMLMYMLAFKVFVKSQKCSFLCIISASNVLLCVHLKCFNNIYAQVFHNI